MSFAGLSRAKRVVSAPPRLARGKFRGAAPPVSLRYGFIGSAPRLGVTTFPHPPRIQTKLEVGDPHDRFEQEAERVADQVLRMPSNETVVPESAPVGSAPRPVQRMCKGCAKEVTPLQRMRLTKATASPRISALRPLRQDLSGREAAQARAAAGAVPDMTPGVEAGLHALRGRGQPLPAAERAFFEPRFGHDFGRVRLHTDTRAADSARTIHARAFTVGRNIVFGGGEYAPDTTAGQQLLAHELAHVVQQTLRNSGGVIQRTPSVGGWIFNTASVSADNCAAAAVHKRLGPDSQFYSSQSLLYPSLRDAVTNGMELKALISKHAAGVSYDMKRVIERNSWQRDSATDPWDPVSGQHKPSGTNDDPNDLDECRTPIPQPHLGSTTVAIYSLDHPGLNPATLRPAATQGVYKATFTESVEIIDANGARMDPNKSDWHSTIWLDKDTSGNWIFNSSESEIALGSIAVSVPAASAGPPSLPPTPPPEFVEPPH